MNLEMAGNWSEKRVREVMEELARKGELSTTRREMVASCSLEGDENSPDSVM
jgi:hypothetical protein